MKKNIFIIGSAGIPARYGGFETFAENIAIRLSTQFNITVFCSQHLYPTSEQSTEWKGVNRDFIPLAANGYQSIFYDLLSIIRALPKADTILILGVGAGLFLPIFRLFTRKRWVVHIDGLEWQRSKWNIVAKTYLKICNQITLRSAHAIIIDNKGILDTIPPRFISRLALIGYGADHLPKALSTENHSDKPFILTIARAEPENNLKLILETCSLSEKYNLVIISNWQQTKYGRELFEIYRGIKHFELIGPIYSNYDLLQSYRTNCAIYLHGHSAGGTNPSLVEAMYAGASVMALDNEFNRYTTNNCALFFSNSLELKKLIAETTTKQLLYTSAKLQEFARLHYTWIKVCEKLVPILIK